MILNKKAIHNFNLKTLIISLLFSMFLLAGCSEPGHEIDSELAKQIALDSAGLKADEVDNLESSDSGSGFDVTFDRGNGSYQIGVGSDGKVISYNYVRDGAESPAASNTDDQPNNEAPKPSESADQVTQPVTTDLPEGSLPKAELISRMASFLGIYQFEETDFKFTSVTPDSVTIDLPLSDGRTLYAEMNPKTGEVIRTGNR